MCVSMKANSLSHFFLDVLETLPMPHTTPPTATLLDSNSMPSSSLDATRQSTCSVSWWCAGSGSLPPAAPRAVSTGPRERQALTRKERLWLSDHLSFEKGVLRVGILVKSNKYLSCLL